MMPHSACSSGVVRQALLSSCMFCAVIVNVSDLKCILHAARHVSVTDGLTYGWLA
jgi:hypothetical protein